MMCVYECLVLAVTRQVRRREASRLGAVVQVCGGVCVHARALYVCTYMRVRAYVCVYVCFGALVCVLGCNKKTESL